MNYGVCGCGPLAPLTLEMVVHVAMCTPPGTIVEIGRAHV